MADRGGNRGGRGGRPSHTSRGNGGLSLDKFVRAKQSTYDPREVKEINRTRAAITIAKYKKLKKRLQGAASDIPNSTNKESQDEDALVDRDETGDDTKMAATAAADRPSSTQRLDKKSSSHHLAEGTSKEEEIALAAAQKEAAKKRRRDEHKLFKKKTRNGQPVMKHKIEKMLQQLEKS